MGCVWIEGENGAFLGYGRVVLLERIRQFVSITEAAKFLDMSYLHAWELVESMNSQSASSLFETATGGSGGGGAKLIDDGERAISLFREFHDEFQDFLSEKSLQIKFHEG
jgi:molybdate transport system regulatory protein